MRYGLQAGQIVDDEVNAVLVNPLLPGVRLHAVIDACHSGSAMDLEYRCKVKQVGLNWKQEYGRRTRVYKVTPSLAYTTPNARLSSLKALTALSRVPCGKNKTWRLLLVTPALAWPVEASMQTCRLRDMRS